MKQNNFALKIRSAFTGDNFDSIAV